MNAAVDLFDRLIDPTLLIRRLYIVANHIIPEDTALQKKDRFTQLDLFTDYAAEEQNRRPTLLTWRVSESCRRRCFPSEKFGKTQCSKR